MKRIAIFCDGTWNWTGADRITHVVRLAQAVRPTAGNENEIPQIVFYLPGVGTGRGATWSTRTLDRFAGGAFGWGLDGNVREAYRNLVFLYEPGDQIYIFGFSRGAYTARSLAGLIRKAGILPVNAVHRVGDAMAFYRLRGDENHPDASASLRRRAELSPTLATSQADLDWRLTQGDTASQILKITYLGVWDTVGAMGLPRVLGPASRVINKKYDFHDQVLSRSVGSARHAVAIDERRKLFPPALWGNLDKLNGNQVGDAAPYKQLWFAGNHGIVGGSGNVPKLSAFPTAWIAEGAEKCGLEFDSDLLRPVTGIGDVRVDDKEAAQQSRATNLFGRLLADRDLRATRNPDTGAPTGPYDADVVSTSAKERVRRTDYGPATLQPVLGDLVRADSEQA